MLPAWTVARSMADGCGGFRDRILRDGSITFSRPTDVEIEQRAPSCL